MKVAWRKAVKPLLIVWAASSLFMLGVPHVLSGGWRAVPFVIMMGGMVTLILGVPAVLILVLMDAAKERRQRQPGS